MRYSRYGARDFPGVTPPRLRARPGSEGKQVPEPTIDLPEGISAHEATVLLGVFARLKENRFGRVEVDLRDGTVTEVRLVEKVDRRLFESLVG